MCKALQKRSTSLSSTNQAEVLPPSLPRSRLKQTFSALQYPNYRLWFIGQLVSLFGTWMQITAQGFLVFELTNSATYLGYVSFAAGIPTWLLTLFGGVVADRIHRRNLLVITQTFMMLLAFILAGLTFLDLVQPWHVIVLAFLLGTANSFDTPARQAFVREMVGREHLTNAIALNSALFNSATAVGPAVAGLTYALVGPAWCFTINGVTFLAVISALLLMRFERRPRSTQRSSAIADIKIGVKYAASHPTIRILIAGLGIVSLFGLGFITLMPAWAVNVLGGDVRTNGLLQSARGLGALLGALMIASLGAFQARGKLLTLGSFAFPSLLLIFTWARSLPLSLVLLVGVGWGFMVLVNLSNSLVQTQVPDELRGRVMSIFTLSFFGVFPIGSLIAGAVADVIGEPATVLLGALIILAFAGLGWWRFPQIRKLV
ncbi:MAG: MFS transporter [Anaerolineales bacterium]|jgi:MFS family permease